MNDELKYGALYEAWRAERTDGTDWPIHVLVASDHCRKHAFWRAEKGRLPQNLSPIAMEESGDDWLTSLQRELKRKGFGDAGRDALLSVIAEQNDTLSESVLKAEIGEDCPVRLPDGNALPFSSFTEALAPGEKQLQAIADSIEKEMEKLSIPEDSLRIVLMGDDTSSFPVTKVLRNSFSGSLFLEDPRFVSLSYGVTEKEIIETAEEHERKLLLASVEVDVEVTDRNGGKKRFDLAAGNASVTLFASRGAVLHLEVNGEPAKIASPYEGMLTLSLVRNQGDALLRIKASANGDSTEIRLGRR